MQLNLEQILTILFTIGAGISGIWLLILKKKKKQADQDDEAMYQRELAKEYREEWLKSQEENNS